MNGQNWFARSDEGLIDERESKYEERKERPGKVLNNKRKVGSNGRLGFLAINVCVFIDDVI